MKLTQEDVNKIDDLTGTAIISSEGNRLGFIAGVFSVEGNTNSQNIPDYIIVGNETLNGSSTKYFAVPAYTKLLEVSGADSTLIAKFEEDHLQRAKRISLDKCPKPFPYEPLIYELIDYPVAQESSQCMD